MTEPWEKRQAQFTRLMDRINALPSIREATMKSANSVRFDTDTADTIIRGNLAAGVSAGARVLTLKLKHYVWVLGQAGGGDTGWVNVTISSGFAQQGSETPQVRRIGNVVYPRGGWSATGMSAGGSHDIGTVPVGYRPTDNFLFAPGMDGGARQAAMRVRGDGIVNIRMGPTVGGYYFWNSPWLVD